MTNRTAYQYRRCLARFADYRVAHPDGALGDSVRAFLVTLRPSVGHMAYLALRLAVPAASVDWTTMPHPRARRDEVRLLATLFGDGELSRARDAATAPRDRAMLELCWTLRRAEVARSAWADVDLTSGTIRAIRKGGKVGWTLLRVEAQAALAEWFVAAKQPPDTAAIFPGRGGRAMCPDTVGRLLRQILRRAGVYRRWRGAHAFRRTLATRYLADNPGDLAGLAKLLGHEGISTTFLYDWRLPAELRPRLDRVRL